MNFVHRPHRLIGDFIAQGGAAETLQPPQRPSGDRQEAGTRPRKAAAKRCSEAPDPGLRRVAPKPGDAPQTDTSWKAGTAHRRLREVYDSRRCQRGTH